MSKLLELADHVEALTGPDREVDALVVTALCPGATIGEYIGYEDVVFHAEAISVPNKEICPFYTASLDAAMILVPEGMWAEGSLASPAALEIHAPMTFDPIGRGWATTPALALCAAALRARHAVGGKE